jgi:hypothetical protein
MIETTENIRFKSFDSIIVLLIIFFGLLICINSFRNTPELKSKPVSAYMSVSNKYAVSNPCNRLQIFLKTWILNKDNFSLLAFNRNPLTVSKKTDLLVSHLSIIRQNSHRIPQFILRYHLFPSDSDLPLFLG